MLNAAAFAQPCEVGSPGAVPGCVNATTPAGILGGDQPSQIAGPAFYRWDFSVFKNFQVTERTRIESGHHMAEEAPEAVADAIRGFLCV